MSKVSKEDEERAKKMLEDFKRARKDTENNPPVRVRQKDKWDYPPGDEAVGETPPSDETGDKASKEAPAKKS